MIWWSLALAGTWLVGVQEGERDLDADGDGRVDGTEATLRCYASSRVCVVQGEVDAGALTRRTGVRYVEADRAMQRPQGFTLTPCPAPSAADEVGYELDRIGVTGGASGGAWAEGRGAGLVMAVQDAGFRTSHVELNGRILGGWDYGDDDSRPEVSPAGVPEHGTFVAGVMVANEDGSGRVGVAPEAELFVQKIADGTGALYFSYAVAAMDDLLVAAPGVRVVDYSIASTDPPRAFEDAVAALGAADVLLVTAAANCSYPSCWNADNDANPVFPANYSLTMDHVLAVSSQRPDGSLDPYSHYGASSVALAAPGADICSLGVSSDQAFLRASGTSYAAPVVAAVAGLARHAFPRLDAGQTEVLLCATSDPDPLVLGQVRCGAANADRALHAAWPDVEDASWPLLVAGATAELSLDVDNLAGGEEVTISVSGSTVTGGAVGALVADGSTTLTVPVLASAAGPATVEVTVSGCCFTDTVAYEVTVVEEASDTGPADTGPTDTGGADPTGDTGGEPVPTATEPPEDQGGCGCVVAAPEAPWSFLSRRREGRAPAPAPDPRGR